MKRILAIAIIVLTSVTINAQIRKADRLYANWDYNRAAQLYERAAAKKPNQDVYYKLGECYQKMHRYKDAVTAYDKVSALGHDTNPSFYLNYGLMLKANERYSDAKNAFSMYSEMVPSDTKGQFYASSCDTVIKDHEYDLPITITSVTSLNSGSADMCPMLYKDGMVFISSRKAPDHGSKIYGWDGEYYLHVFYAKRGTNDTNFTNVAPLEGHVVNRKYHNGPVCFSQNFDTIYFNSVNKDLKGHEKKTLNIERNKIYLAVNEKGDWAKMQPFQYNNDTFSVATPYLTKNGSRIYFASDMPGGYGGADIYYCDKQGSSWSKPVNMGPNINTFGNEKFPSLDSAGDLYFSSDGYKGYGGMDICVSKNNNGNFQQAAVLKAPYNSAGDDYGVTFLKEGRIGYFASNRSGGRGDEDIYYFNLDKDSLPCSVSTSEYVIGFRCPQKPKPFVAIDTNKDTTVHSIVMEPKQVDELDNSKVTSKVYFDFDRYNIRPDAAIILDSIARAMKENTGMKVVINAYCDSRGSYSYNQVLSERRAESTVNYLANKGINRKRMVGTGYGKTHFVNKCADGVVCTSDEHALNRRSEMIVKPEKGSLASSGQ